MKEQAYCQLNEDDFAVLVRGGVVTREVDRVIIHIAFQDMEFCVMDTLMEEAREEVLSEDYGAMDL